MVRNGNGEMMFLSRGGGDLVTLSEYPGTLN
jgi:hypothetical protein